MVYLRVYCNGEKVRSMGHSMREVRYEMGLYNGEHFSSKRKATSWLRGQIPKKQLDDIDPSKSFRFYYEIIRVRRNKTKVVIESGDFLNHLQFMHFRKNEYTISLVTQDMKFLYSGLSTI